MRVRSCLSHLSRSFLGLVLVFAIGAFLFGATQSQAVESQLDKQLRDRLKASKSQLGDLKPWQSKVFDEDVLSHPGRFLKDYRSNSAQSVSVVVDDDAIRSFLGFHALPEKTEAEQQPVVAGAPAQPQPPSRLAWIVAKSSADCEPCTKLLPIVKANLEAQLVRRGFTTVTLNDSKAAAGRAKVGLYTVLSVGLAAKDPEDTAHADEVGFEVRLSHFANPGEREIATELKNTVPESSAILAKAEQMMLESFVDLGSRQGTKVAESSESSSSNGLEIRVLNISNESIFGKLLEPLRTQVGAVLVRASAGTAYFKVMGSKSREETIQMLEKLEGLDKKWTVQKSPTEGDNVIEARLQ